MRICSSVGSVTVAVPLLVIAPISLLLPFEFVEYDVELVESLRPAAFVGLDPVVDGFEGVAVEPVEPLSSFVAHLNRPDLSEYPQVLRHLWLGQAEQAHQVVHGPFAAREGVEDRSSPRLGYGVERVRCGCCSCHTGIICPYRNTSSLRRVTVMEHQRVAVRIREVGHVADAAVDGVREEGDALRLEARARLLDVAHVQRDRVAVPLELQAERIGLHDGDGQGARLELTGGHVAPALREREAEDLAVELAGLLVVTGGHGDEVDARDAGCCVDHGCSLVLCRESSCPALCVRSRFSLTYAP